MAIRLILFLLASVAAQAQLTTLSSLDVLLSRTPIRGERVGVSSGLSSNDWGGVRIAQHYTNSSGFATNLGNVFQAKGATNGQWGFVDRTNSVQNMRWWGGSPNVADNTAALTNCAAWVASLGGGYIYIPTGTYPLLSGGLTMPSGVRLRGDGPNATVFDFTSATPAYDYEPVLSWEGTVAATVRLQSQTIAGNRSLTTASSVDWAWGEMIQIADTNKFSFGSRPDYHEGEFNFVYSNTSGTNIVLQEALEASYPTASTVINRITPATGSVEGIHFALGTKSGPVLLRYCDQDSYIENCSAAGSEDTHFWIDSCYASRISNSKVDYGIDPATGGGYGLKFGDSENLVIGPGNFFRTSIHGISGGGSTVPTRYVRIFGSTLGSTRQTTAGADMHGDVVESQFSDCTFLSGLTLGGGRNKVVNSTIRNGRGVPGLAVGECRYYDWEVADNRFLISSFDDEAESVWAARFLLTTGDYSGDRASTNYWPGTFGGTASQSIKFVGNEIQFTGARTNGNYAVSIDEAATLTANTNLSPAQFGAVIVRGNRILSAPDQPDVMDESPGVFVYTRSKIRWSTIDVSQNPYLDSASVQVRVHTGDVQIKGNTFANLKSSQGVFVNPPSVGSVVDRLDTEVSGNLFISPIGSAFTVVGTTGRVIGRNNLIYNHGRTNTGYSLNGIAVYDGADPVNGIELYDNLVASTNAGTRDVYILTAGSLRDERTQIGGSVTAGTRSISGGYIRVPFIVGAVGSTNALALLGQYTALPTASSFPPALAHSAGDLWYSDGASWNAVQKSGTNFHNLRATNGLVGGDLIAATATIGANWPGSKTAIDGRVPLVVARNTNAFLTAQIYNNDSGASAASVLDVTASGMQGRFFGTTTNASSAAAQARVGVQSVSGTGIQFDLTYPSSQDIVMTYGGGTEFARLSTNTLSVPGLTTKAATNVIAYVNGTTADATSTARAVVNHAISSLGRELIAAGSQSAAQSILGISSGSFTNLDNLTVTNAARFGSNFTISDTIGGTDRFTLTGSGINSFLQFSSFGDFLVSSAAGIYASSTNNWFYNGLNQYWPGTSDRVWLTSLGFKNAAPLRGANILDGTEIDWTTSSTTNVTPSIKSASITTNKIDSTFYNFITSQATGGTATTNYVVKALMQNAAGLTVAATTLSETNMVTTQPSWAVTNFAAGYWTTNNALHVEASGTFSAAGDWSGNAFRVKLGGYVLTYTFDEPDSTTPTDAAWRLVADIKVQTPGASATVMGVGSLTYYQGTPTTMLQSGFIAAVASGTLDTTVQNTLSVTYDNDGTQPLTLKMASLFANEIGAAITSGGGGSTASGSLVSVNGTTNNWNFNSTTPAAPAQSVNIKYQTSGTNVSGYLPIAPTLFPVTSQAWSNTTTPQLVASGYLNSTNLPYDGATIQGSVVGLWFNNSGVNTAMRPIFMANGQTNWMVTTGGGAPTVNAANANKPWRLDFEFARITSNTVSGGCNYVIAGNGNAPVGYGALSVAAAATTRPIVFATTTCDLSTNVLWELYLATELANNTNIMTVLYGGLK
jgi:hypothetical protein